ncbi:hypothetical protein [uncultured Muribaculum sp.]|uniref:hypothetical protein n=1 Tax=uncultured Muribaculum sp. TaxID=1918613 RepID=UPI0026384B23|nr:hypothetical protein [uncultured Muribaculum sp.]
MNRHEFEVRTGWDISDDDYAHIEKIYMNAGEMDKDKFCRDYAKGNGHEIMNYLSKAVDDQRSHVSKLDQRISNLERERGEMVDFMIAKHVETQDESFRKYALELLGGTKQYILRKCHMALPLDDLEQAWIIELLESSDKQG